MNSTIGLAAFRIGCFVAFVSGMLLFFEERGTAEYAISLITFIMGVSFLVAVAIWVRLTQRKP
ncbi:MAG: hypothetical protein R3A44_08320 [Caldilineaceae bacterium]